MEKNWSFIPQHIFDEIVKEFSWTELKAFSTVCHGWQNMVDSFWRKRVVLNLAVVNTSILEQSLSHYENLNISSRVKLSKTQRIFKILRERNLEKKNVIKSIDISHQKAENIIEILKDAGKDLNQLSIAFKENEKASIPFSTIPSLAFVKYLQVSANENLLQISSNFTGLHELVFSVLGNSYEKNMECLENLISINKSSLKVVRISFPGGFRGDSLQFLEDIEQLYNLSLVSKGDPIELRPDLFRKRWNLVSLTLNPCTLTNNDLLNILNNYKSLRHLTIGFSTNSTFEPETIQQIWDLPNLQSLEYPRLEVTSDYSIINTVSKTVTRLTLDNVRLCFDFSKLFPHRAPNLEYFNITDKHYRELTRYDLMDKLQQLPYLKVLHLNFSFRFLDNTRYSNLEELYLGKYSNDISIDWSNLEVPKLNVLKLDSCSSWENNTLEKCLKACSSIKSLHVKSFKQTCDKTIEILSKKLPNLEVLKFGYMNWEQLTRLLRNKSPMSLKIVELDFSKNDFFCLNEGMVEEISEILRTPIRLCEYFFQLLNSGNHFSRLKNSSSIGLYKAFGKASMSNYPSADGLVEVDCAD